MDSILPASWIGPITDVIHKTYTLSPYIEPSLCLGKNTESGLHPCQLPWFLKHHHPTLKAALSLAA